MSAKRIVSLAFCFLLSVFIMLGIFGCGFLSPTSTDETCVHEWKDATCTTPKICTLCGETEGEALNHTWQDATCTTPKTCSACAATEGQALGHTGGTATCSSGPACTACGTVYGQALGHNWGEWTTNNGTHTRVCQNNSAHTESAACAGGTATCENPAACATCTREYGDALGHEYGAWTVTAPATCTTAGVKQAACVHDGCTATMTDSVPATGHTYVAAVTAPTCTLRGYTTHTCACGDTKVDTFVDAAGHNWDILAPTCTQGQSCADCDAETPALGHTYDDGVTTPATCTEAEVTVYTCQRQGCGDSYEEFNGEPLEHDIDGVTPTLVAVPGTTCDFVQYYTCQRADCGEEVAGPTVTRHENYVATIVTPATCMTAGEKRLNCTECGYEKPEYEEIPVDTVTGHTWDAGVESAGVTTYTCQVNGCGQTKTSVVVRQGDTVNAEALKDAELQLEGGANITLGGAADAIGNKDVAISASTVNKDTLGLNADQLSQVGENEVYNFSIMDGTTPISQFGEDGFITVSLPYTLEEGENVDSIAVWYIDSDGNLTSIRATYNNGFVTFRTNHFSYYTVTELTPAERCAVYGHTSLTQTVSPTCTTAGYTLSYCLRCGASDKTDIVPALGHTYEVDAANSTSATCTAAGRTRYVCTRTDCGRNYVQGTPATGHDWEVQDSVTANCMQAGYTVYVCRNTCGRTYTERSAQLPHAITDTVVPATCTDTGYTLHVCTNEGCTYECTDTLVQPLGHSYAYAFTWNDDYTQAILTVTCVRTGCDHAETIQVTNISVTEVSAAGNIAAHTVYTARVTHNGQVRQDVKIQMHEQTPAGPDTNSLAYELNADKQSYKVSGIGTVTGVDIVIPTTYQNLPVTAIADSAFSRCTTIKSVVIPEGVTSIGNWAFSGCSAIERISIPKSVTSIGDVAFGNCASLTSVTFGGTAAEWLDIEKGDDWHYGTGEYTVVCTDGRVAKDGTVTENSDCNHEALTETVIDVSGYDLCFAELYVSRCACGEVVRIMDMDWLEDVCDWSEIDEDYGTGADGNEYMSSTLACEYCSAELYLYAFLVKDGCSGIVTYEFTLTVGDEVLLDKAQYIMENEEMHGDRNYETVDLSTYSTCGGYYNVEICTDCGETVYVSRPITNCNFTSADPVVTVDENGNEHTVYTAICSACGFRYVQDEWQEPISECEYYECYTTALYYGDLRVYYKEDRYTDDDHEYDVTYELQGESCEDGWTAVYTCTVCGDSYRDFGDWHRTTTAYDSSNADLNICDHHYFRVESCFCGEERRVSYSTSMCSDCGFRVVDEDTEAVDGCYRVYTRTVALYVGDTELYRDVFTQRYAYHDMTLSAELLADGRMSVVAVCANCDLTTAFEQQNGETVTLVYNENLDIYCYDLMVVPEEDAYYTIYSMNDDDTYIHLYSIDEDGEYREVDRNDDGGNGNNFRLETYLEAGVTYVYRLRFYSSSNSGDITYVLSATAEENGGASCGHDFEERYATPAGAGSCEDGVACAEVCTLCGAIQQVNVVYEHNTEWLEIDLSEYGACGGYVYGERCRSCGLIIRVSDVYYECDGWYEAETDRGEIETMPGYDFETMPGYEIETMPGYEIETMPGYEIETMPGYEIETMPDYEIETMPGYEIETWVPVETAPIIVPGEVETAHDHAFLQTLTTGYNAVTADSTETDVNGVVHTYTTRACSVCGLTLTTDVWEEAVSACESRAYRQEVLSINGTVIFTYERVTHTETYHDYDVSVQLNGESCEDGWTATYTCTVCGESYRSSGSWHYRERIYDIADEDTDFCEFHIFYVEECACGEERYVSYSSHECSDCGLRVTDEENEELSDCELRTIRTVTLYAGDAVLYEYVGTWAYDYHEMTITAENLPDGSMLITAMCANCPLTTTYTQEAGETVTLVYNEDFGMYCYDLTFVPEEDAYYTIYSMNNNDTYVHLYSVDEDGEYYEVACNDDGGNGNNFRLETYLEAGVTYVYRLRFCSSSNSGDITYVLGVSAATEGDGEDNDCDHATRGCYALPAGAASCTDGLVGANVCYHCGNVLRAYVTTEHVAISTYYDLSDYGACYGYVEIGVCPCGQEGWAGFDSCYHDRNYETVIEDGIEHEIYTYTCDDCGKVMVCDYYVAEEGCARIVYVNIDVSMGGESVLYVSGMDYVEYHHTWQYAYVFDNTDGEPNCEDGVRVTMTCADCALTEEEHITGHREYYTEYDLAEYGACGGYLTVYSCPCGYYAGADYGFYECDYNHTSDSYIEDGIMHHVYAYTCDDCGLRYQCNYYTVRDADTCRDVTYYEASLNIGAVLVRVVNWERSQTSHQYTVTGALQEGATSCEDGVTVTYTCYCGETYSRNYTSHQMLEVERYDLGEYGAIADHPGYVVKKACPCGARADIALADGYMCEFGTQYIDCWVEGYLSGYRSPTAEDPYRYDSYGLTARILACAVTDPEQCTCRIRYTIYYAPVEGECLAEQWEIWQLGYDPATGTCALEIKVKTGYTLTYHRYESTSLDETYASGTTKISGTRYDCPDCGSYYYEENTYREDGSHSENNLVYVNTLNDGRRKGYAEHREYDTGNNTTLYRYTYTEADGTETWGQYEYVRNNAYTHTVWGTVCNGRDYQEIYTNSDGDTWSVKQAYITYAGYTYYIYEERTYQDGSWYRYDYDYSGDICTRTTTYTDSDGANETSSGTCHHTSRRTEIYPTCTQSGEGVTYCVVCSETTERYEISPYGHYWYYIEDNFYFCERCGLENSNGSDGDIVLEDLTAQYGNGENYVAGYWARNEVQFLYNVSLWLRNPADGVDPQVILADIEVFELSDVRALAFSKSAVEAAAAALGYAPDEYDVRLSFVPLGADERHDYAVTFTEEEIIEVSEAGSVTFDMYVYQRVRIYITPAESGTWTMYSTVDFDSYGTLYGANGVVLTYDDDGGATGNNFQISYDLTAGETYILEVRPYSTSSFSGVQSVTVVFETAAIA